MDSDSAKTARPPIDKRVIFAVGGFFLLFGVYILAFMLPDFIVSAAGPTSIPLAEAAAIASDQNSYVHVTDGEWNCDSIHYVWGRSSSNAGSAVGTLSIQSTEAFVTNGNAPQALLVRLSDEQDCAALQAIQPTGYLTRMSDERQQALTNEARMARFFNQSEFLEMCGYCGSNNALLGVIGGSVSLVLGIGILIFARRSPKS